MKIIHILCHSPSPVAYESGPTDSPPSSSNPDDDQYAIKISKPPYWICFAQNDFHVKLATEINRNTDRYVNECWRPYKMADKMYSQQIHGIMHKVFPSREPLLKRPYFGEVSSLLCSELKREIKRNDVIVHLHGFHTPFIDMLLLKASLDKVPIVVTQRGQGYPGFMLRDKPWVLPRWIFQKIYSSKIDVYLFQSKFEYDYLVHKFGEKRVMMHQDGLDFATIKPVEKKLARKMLGISDSCKMLLYVGIFDPSRGVENAIWAFEKLRSQDENIHLYLIGGHKSHELYGLAKRSRAIAKERIITSELIYYYSAADIHIYPTSSRYFRRSTGISNANMEALACNTPLYTSQLIHFLGTDRERAEIGMDSGLIKEKNKMISDIRSMFDKLDDYKNCRNLAKKYYDRVKNTRKLIDIYKQVESYYYA